VNPIDPDGKFTSQVPELKGMFAKDADPKIIDWLDEMGLLIAKYPYEHDYPYCWRCNKPLLYYAMKSWFIKVSDVVSKLLKQNSKIKWFPPTIGSGRFGNWLENARDWSLSRTRFWGTPLPIWRCSCGELKVVGSRKELIENSVGEVDDDLDLHRPYVDGVKLSCACGLEMERVEDVIDCWYDSGAATFAQFHYPSENKDMFKEYFPYDFISEATDQTRGWFYTLLVLGTILFEKPAYKNCVVGGLLLDEQGEKMSKSNNNIIDPWQLFKTVGADAVRLQMCTTAPWNAKRFGIESMNESVKPMLRTLWNSYSFTVRYMLLDDFDPREHDINEDELLVEDKWILSSADKLVIDVNESLSNHEYHHAVSHLYNFIVEDLSRWYIKLIRDRLWLEDTKGVINPSKKAAYLSLKNVFQKLSLCMAPFAPFITEEIYLNLLKKEVASIHHMLWPKDDKVDEELISNMGLVRKLFEAGSRCRQAANIKLRYPIAKVTVSGDDRIKEAVTQLDEVIKKQLNCKKLEFKDELPEVSYQVAPDYAVIGPKHGKQTKKVAVVIMSNPGEAKEILQTNKEKKIKGVNVSPEMISDIRLIVPEKHSATEFTDGISHGLVLIETDRSQSLINEALARDLIRHIQELRRKNNLDELQRIEVEVSSNEDVEGMLSEFQDMVLNEVRGNSINISKTLKSPDTLVFNENTLYYKIHF
jgi:isoleucyl-tRNA synthetase